MSANDEFDLDVQFRLAEEAKNRARRDWERLDGVLFDLSLTKEEKLVLLALMRLRHSRSGIVWASNETVARALGGQARTASRTLRSMILAGKVERNLRPGRTSELSIPAKTMLLIEQSYAEFRSLNDVKKELTPLSPVTGVGQDTPTTDGRTPLPPVTGHPYHGWQDTPTTGDRGSLDSSCEPSSDQSPGVVGMGEMSCFQESKKTGTKGSAAHQYTDKLSSVKYDPISRVYGVLGPSGQVLVSSWASQVGCTEAIAASAILSEMSRYPAGSYKRAWEATRSRLAKTPVKNIRAYMRRVASDDALLTPATSQLPAPANSDELAQQVRAFLCEGAG